MPSARKLSMRVLRIVGNTDATVELTQFELGVLNNALNETLEALDTEEFETRVGASPQQVQTLLQEFGAVLERMNSGSA